MASLLERAGLIGGNIIVSIAVITVMVAVAVIVSKAIAKTSDPEAKASLTKTATMLWVMIGLGIVFTVFVGIFFLPWLVNIPYLFGAAMTTLSIVFIATGASLLKIAAKTDKSIRTAGILLITSAVMMIGYSTFTIYRYVAYGGITADVALVGDISGGGTTTKAAGLVAKSKLSEDQRKSQSESAGWINKLGIF